MSVPKRIQMSRQHPWRADNPGAVIVARPSKWGNPGRWWPGPYVEPQADGTLRRGRWTSRDAREIATQGFRDMLANPGSRHLVGYPHDDEIRAALAGRDLACWCRTDEPCHGDVLLAIARGEEL